MKVYWTQEARTRLQEIEAYIAKDSPSKARKAAGRLVRRSLGLMQLPHLGRHLPEYSDTTYGSCWNGRSG